MSMSMSMSKELGFYIPEDIVVRILIKLPVKSLVRFSCVSKRWRSIISDPKFAKSHLQLASQQGTLRRKFLISTYIEPGKQVKTSVPVDAATLPSQFRSWKLLKTRNPPNEVIATFQSRFQSLEDNFNATSVRNLTFPSKDLKQRALASCNGLVLLCQYSDHCIDYNELSIWNPSTGYLRKIPSSRFKLPTMNPHEQVKLPVSMHDDCGYVSTTMKRHEVQLPVSINYGFGYVSAIEDYILVFVVPSQEPASRDCEEVHVFSLKANSWKVIYVTDSLCTCIGGQGTLSNGAFHWVNDGFGHSDSAVHAFDLVVEKSRQVPLPRPFRNEGGVGRLKILAHFGGCLCLQREMYFNYEIWAMTEYGVAESWIKLFQFDYYDMLRPWNRPAPCYVVDIGTVVIKLPAAEVVMIEYGEEEKLVCGGRYRLEPVPGCTFRFDMTEYDETLISVA